jgi:DNA modification methylase
MTDKSLASRCHQRLDHIITGDCLRHLAEMPEATVDLAFADPPSNIGYDGSGTTLARTSLKLAAFLPKYCRFGFFLQEGLKIGLELRYNTSVEKLWHVLVLPNSISR